MRTVLLILMLIAVATIAGCVSQTVATGSDMSITAYADPPKIKPGESTRLSIDIENTGQLDMSNMTVSVFDTGLLKILGPVPNVCGASFGQLRHSQIASTECTLVAPLVTALVDVTTTADISFRATFGKNITTAFSVDAMTLDEIRRQERVGTLVHKPQSFSFGDGQMQATIQFNKIQPFTAGETVLAQLNIRNAGPGDIRVLEPQNFVISGSENFKCSLESQLFSSSGVFPPITCIFTVPSEIQTAATYPISLAFVYNYEMRDLVTVVIQKYE